MSIIQNRSIAETGFCPRDEFLRIPSLLTGFQNTETSVKQSCSGKTVYRCFGYAELTDEERICSSCGCRMHINNSYEIELRYLPYGNNFMQIALQHNQLICPECGAMKMQGLPFKCDGHRITQPLCQFVCDLLAEGSLTIKWIANHCGLSEKTVNLPAVRNRRLVGAPDIHCGYPVNRPPISRNPVAATTFADTPDLRIESPL